jgi:hypothetical protein
VQDLKRTISPFVAERILKGLHLLLHSTADALSHEELEVGSGLLYVRRLLIPLHLRRSWSALLGCAARRNPS